MTSPFVAHRDKVLGHYSTAAWLRRLVLAMWNGNAYPVGLSQLTNLDDSHAKAVLEMLSSYRQNGENDATFMALAEECRARLEEEAAAAQRADEFEAWLRQVRSELRTVGLSRDLADDRYDWFEGKFNAGLTPGDAAREAARANLV
ncbi:DUF7673 family protein [Cupriavidus nantongensis]|uniref:DUF7673 domain-containing protein n=1 Tax=Cupriavidus nantongensis TaxID=1796606 RepID=A0A142JIS2_9BURK|nr:hypothetical protein [Cupriavidus nantongensis]AMR77984.1 hypothetical protein A2G96_09655 [Cupriavidus nantongensis]